MYKTHEKIIYLNKYWFFISPGLLVPMFAGTRGLRAWAAAHRCVFYALRGGEAGTHSRSPFRCCAYFGSHWLVFFWRCCRFEERKPDYYWTTQKYTVARVCSARCGKFESFGFGGEWESNCSLKMSCITFCADCTFKRMFRNKVNNMKE